MMPAELAAIRQIDPVDCPLDEVSGANSAKLHRAAVRASRGKHTLQYRESALTAWALPLWVCRRGCDPDGSIHARLRSARASAHPARRCVPFPGRGSLGACAAWLIVCPCL